MINENILYLFFIFIIYSFFGFFAETIYLFLTKSKSNRGLYGPWCPIYGVGGVALTALFLNFEINPVFIFIIGFILSSLIEYSISFLLEKIFQIRWWDYSGRIGNLNGRICLRNSILFGILSVLTLYLFWPLILFVIVNLNNESLYIITLILIFSMSIDAVISIFEASNLKRYIEIVSKSLKKKESNKTLLRDKTFAVIKKLEGNYSPKRILDSFPSIKVKEEKSLEYIKWYYKKKKGGKK